MSVSMALWLSVETLAIIAKPKKAKHLTVQRKNGRILIAYFETFPPPPNVDVPSLPFHLWRKGGGGYGY